MGCCFIPISKKWNSIGSNLKFFIVDPTDSQADITVSYDPAFFDAKKLGNSTSVSSIPMNGKPFGKIWINDIGNKQNYYMIMKILMLKKGHTIGLGHQNKVDSGTKLISGTPGVGGDKYSIMA